MAHYSISRIAKKFGRTVPAMKKILEEEGVLMGTQAMQWALDAGVARLKPLNPEVIRYEPNGRTHYNVWSLDYVTGVMARRGEAPGEKKVTPNRHAVVSAFAKIAIVSHGVV